MKPELTVDVSLLGNASSKPSMAQAELSPLGGGRKRLFDILIALAALAVLLPIMILVAALVWSYDRQNPLFGHGRIGWGGKSFRCLKFRSMVPNASAVLEQLLQTDERARAEWRETQKLRSDPRVTPIGKILRLSSLDELPQLFNVLKGDMSIIGPRPIVLDEIEKYGADFDRYRSCRPGLTGLWQVSGRSDCSYMDRVRFDVAYTSGWSMRRDIVIFIRTIPVVLARKGSC